MSVCPPLRAEASPSVSFFFDFENRGQNKMLLGIFLGGEPRIWAIFILPDDAKKYRAAGDKLCGAIYVGLTVAISFR